MVRVSILSIVLFFSLCFPLLAQVQERQLVEKVQEMGIESIGDLNAALKSRGMTVEQAKALAEQQGISFDEFTAKYLGTKVSTNAPELKVVESAAPFPQETLTSDSVVSKIPDQELEVKELNPITVEKAEQTLNVELAPFGYDFFRQGQRGETNNAAGAGNPNYVLQPGDAIRLLMWGDVEMQFELELDARGYIFIPSTGQFLAGGLSFKAMEKKLQNYLSKNYRGLNSKPPRIFMDVSLTKVRPIQIYLIGEVEVPGAHTISSFSDIFNAISTAGGIKESGSLRDIAIFRGGKKLGTIDLYQFLFGKEHSEKISLADGDRIYVAGKGNSVQISGEVKREGIYEMKDSEGLKNLVEFALGLRPTAYPFNVPIERIIPIKDRKLNEDELRLINIDYQLLKELDEDFQLVDGDNVHFAKVNKPLENFVEISGAVWRPGVFQLDDEMTLHDLIMRADGLTDGASLEKADLVRENADGTFKYQTITDINSNSSQEIKLSPRDKVRVYSKLELQPVLPIALKGFVKTEIETPFEEGITLYDLLYRSSGFEDANYLNQVYLKRGDILRLSKLSRKRSTLPFVLADVLNKKVNFVLKPGDEIIIYKDDVDQTFTEKVWVKGFVKNPGAYELRANMTISDLILQAKGFKDDALLTRVILDRQNVKTFDQLYNRSMVYLDSAFSRTQFLYDKDVVTVLKDPSFKKSRTVELTGEFLYAGPYLLDQRVTYLSDVVALAGGITSDANPKALKLSREGVNLAFDFDKLLDHPKNKRYDLILNDGDVVNVPRKLNAVYVNGEVNLETLLSYTPGKRVKSYVKSAGGRTNSSRYILYKKPNGINKKLRWNIFSGNPVVDDGSIITVTSKNIKVAKDKLNTGRLITDIFAIASSAVTIMVLAKNL